MIGGIIAITLMLALVSCGGGSPSLAGTYPLPSDGWKPGDASQLALTVGPFEAVLTPAGACASLGKIRPLLWPAGYRVRFHPTELIDPKGDVVARAGDVLSTGGGVQPPGDEKGRCTDPNEQTWAAQSTPKKA